MLFTDDGCYYSSEFNGNMWYLIEWEDNTMAEGYGMDVLEMMGSVRTKEDFEKCVYEFNSTHHKYKENEVGVFFVPNEKLDEYLDMKKLYNRYFSDYLYVKNASSHDLTFDLLVKIDDDDLVELDNKLMEEYKKIEKPRIAFVDYFHSKRFTEKYILPAGKMGILNGGEYCDEAEDDGDFFVKVEN